MTILPASDVAPDLRDVALGLLFPDQRATQSTESRRHPFRDSFPAHHLDDVLVAVNQTALLGAVFVECLSGACANIWGPGVSDLADRPSVESVLLEESVRYARSRRIRVLQAFRQVDDDPTALERIGLKRITTIRTLQRESVPAPSYSNLLRFIDQSQGVSPEFQGVLLDSFEGSLDCPEWNGLRTPSEVLEGHRSAAPDLSRWWLASWGEWPIGVLILTDGWPQGFLELSYLGVAPAFRGRHFGRDLVAFAIEQSIQQQTRGLTLLVDERNRPAIDAYAAFGFEMVQVRNVFLRQLQLI